MMMRRRTTARRPRRGFTLIEMIIAIIVMSIGVMGLASTASYVAQQMGSGNMQTVAAALSSKVADSLSSRKCAALVAGSQTKRGVTVSWTVTTATRIRTVDQTVTYKPKRGSTKTINYRMVVQCPD
jgi:prepilin-type N-terminal cleavage/methylation domain-containing protein